MESLVRILTPALGRTLRDETGLMGLYDWELHFDPEVFRQVGMQAGLSPALVAPAPSDSPSLMTALQEQLGLRLDARRGPVDHLIIEHVEAPAPD
jgi:uncharacterized protein (TIGR03435 family)